MIISSLQRLTVGCFAALRHGLDRVSGWLWSSPTLSGWFYAPEPVLSRDDAYRKFNSTYFAQLDQQERMLADRPRMTFYHAIIERHVAPGSRVIDLGTGTGILAAFAARQGAARVYAIDHAAILDVAQEVIAHNRVPNVEFIAQHSSDVVLDEPVDIILHEQMGDYLFDESMVANICDLRDRLLKPGGRILPSRFEFYCEPVKLHDERHVPFIWDLNLFGIDYGFIKEQRPDEAEYYRQASCDLGVVEAFLGEPKAAIEFDLHTVDDATMPRKIRIKRPVVTAGRLDGFAVYFKVLVDDDLTLSSSPLDPDRAPHWGFRLLRCEMDDLGVGDVVTLTLEVGRWADPDSWNWHYERRSAAALAEMPTAS
ncbi:50S ribosomal protein L11 methyltransferase [Synoicihabitans lomoniglobus]|uniref:50S ribosomal protein L11 methyltransferase n=1 Tax=Synoicihabitans lomoniglobus TaxID=2909285 RepID=A0AAF0CMT3_9BACT|nr:50S ribosomal protein L11 methyltransferase [Opitutaceae bacterium LMO-M01]WED64608.1 50S ribosomal protein L11 methyltransferase [Opitutaceae bacterium LMO-M01]